MTRPAVMRIDSQPDSLSIQWADGEVSDFASPLLRDNLREDRDPHSGQRLVDIADLPEAPRIRTAVLENGSVRIEWESEPRGAVFDLDWLAAHAMSDAPRPQDAARRWLDGAALDAARDFARATLGEIRGSAALRLQWLTHLLQDGIAFLTGLAAEEAAILDAVSLLGRVAETNYGRVFDVRSVPQPENLAYSDLGLGLHTDNPYREPVPGFQALHVLIASPDGGDSLFADGFALADYLRAIDPGAFSTLSRTPVPFLYRSKDAELFAERPLIQLSCHGAVAAVHYNSRSVAPLRLAARDASAFYAAYRRFAALLRDPRYQLRLRMQAGDMAVFDNQRILHGRTGFSSAAHARHLRGCYLTRDSVYGEAALLRRRLVAQSA